MSEQTNLDVELILSVMAGDKLGWMPCMARLKGSRGASCIGVYAYEEDMTPGAILYHMIRTALSLHLLDKFTVLIMKGIDSIMVGDTLTVGFTSVAWHDIIGVGNGEETKDAE